MGALVCVFPDRGKDCMCKQYGWRNARPRVSNTVCTYGTEVITLIAHTMDAVERRWAHPAAPHGVRSEMARARSWTTIAGDRDL